MKISTTIIATLGAIFIVSCKEPTPSSRVKNIEVSNQLSGFNTITSPQGNWMVMSSDVEQPGLKIFSLKSRSAGNDKKITDVGLPAAWPNSKDTFVFIDSDERIWAFDGSNQIFIYEPSGLDGGGKVVDFSSKTGSIPSEFLKRLPPNLIK